MTKRKNKVYTQEFKQEAVALVLEQGDCLIFKGI